MSILCINEILDEYQRIVTDNKASFDPDIELVQKGGLDLLPASVDLSSKVPAFFIIPLPNAEVDFNPKQSYEVDYPFRFVYIRNFESDEKSQEKVIAEASILMDLLISDAYFDLPALNAGGAHTLPNGQVIYQKITGFDTLPAEANTPLRSSGDFILFAFELFVNVRHNRQ